MIEFIDWYAKDWRYVVLFSIITIMGYECTLLLVRLLWRILPSIRPILKFRSSVEGLAARIRRVAFSCYRSLFREPQSTRSSSLPHQYIHHCFPTGTSSVVQQDVFVEAQTSSLGIDRSEQHRGRHKNLENYGQSYSSMSNVTGQRTRHLVEGTLDPIVRRFHLK